MSKILMILDQIQAGAGGKEKADLPPAGKSLPLGPGDFNDTRSDSSWSRR